MLANLVSHNAILNGLTKLVLSRVEPSSPFKHSVVVHRAIVSDKLDLKGIKVPHGDFSGPNNYGSVPLEVPVCIVVTVNGAIDWYIRKGYQGSFMIGHLLLQSTVLLSMSFTSSKLMLKVSLACVVWVIVWQ